MELLGASVLSCLAIVVLIVAVELKAGLEEFARVRHQLLAGPRTAIAESCSRPHTNHRHSTGPDSVRPDSVRPDSTRRETARIKAACMVTIYWHDSAGWSSPCGTNPPVITRRYYRTDLVCHLGKFQIYRRTSVVLR
jgi:hypothetical protein